MKPSSLRRSFSAALFALSSLLLAPSNAQGTHTPSLSADAPRLGDEMRFTVQGDPLTPGLLGIALGPSPTLPRPHTTFGGLGTTTLVRGFTLDASGTANRSFLLPTDSSLVGLDVQARAFVLASTGFQITNQVRAEAFPPRIYFRTFGDPVFNPNSVLVSFDALGAANEFTASYSSPMTDAVFVPSLDRIAVLLETGELLLLDPKTGATTRSITITPTPSSLDDLQVAPFPGRVRIRSTQATTQSGLRLIDLQTGETVGSLPGPVYQATNIPGTTRVVVRDANRRLTVLDDATGQIVWTGTQIPLTNGFPVDWFLDGDRLVVLLAGTALVQSPAEPAALYPIDLQTGAPLAPAPIPIPSPADKRANSVRLGAGPGGTVAVVTFHELGSASSEFLAVSPTTFAPVAPTLAVSAGVEGPFEMVPSPGGTEWLALFPGATVFQKDGYLLVVDAATFTQTGLVPLGIESQTALLTLPSDTLRRVYIGGATSPNAGSQGFLLELPTDPVVGPPTRHALGEPVGLFQNGFGPRISSNE
ncbi:MAG TPA: hypothetical protein ENJ09_02755 [Planctomycetes bacterium]|nr:hypothetical protein [Planctomycetota bacterium]